MREFNNRKKREILMKVLGCLILAVAAGYRISQLTAIHMLYDEFGYSASAAYYAGYDWSPIAGRIAYYSYGLGLLLSVFMRIAAGNAVLYYHLGIIFNIALLLASFLIACNVGRKLFKDIPEYVVIIAAFAISLYPNTLTQTNILWSETLMYFLFWVSTWSLVKLIETSKKRYTVIFTVAAMYMYMVHQRALAVIIAACMTMIIYLLQHKDKKNILTFIFTLAGMAVIATLMKNNIRENIWSDPTLAAGNDYDGQLYKVKMIFSGWTGFKAFLVSLTGKVYYILIAGFMFVAAAAAGFIKKLIDKEYEHLVIYSYLFLCLIGSIGISAIFMITGVRQDTLMYGRYTEYVIGPLLLTGILFTWNQKLSKWFMGLFTGAAVITAVLVYIKLRNTGMISYIVECATGLGLFFQDGRVAGYAPLLAGAVSIGGYLIFGGLSGKIKQAAYRIVVIIALPVMVWGCTNYKIQRSTANLSQGSAVYQDTAERIREYSGQGELPVYYLTDEGNANLIHIEIVQYFMPEITIRCVRTGEITSMDEFKDGIVVVCPQYFDMEALTPEYRILEESQNMVILKR